MNIETEEQREPVHDLNCDFCDKDLRSGELPPEFGVLRANWGPGSSHDGENYELQLCETCFFRILADVKRERLVRSMFDDYEEDHSELPHVF